MEEQKNQYNLKECVMREIAEGKIAMRSKKYFFLKLAAVVALCALIIALSVFVFNIMLFGLKLRGHDLLLGFGPRGWLRFLRFLPWTLLLVDLCLVVGLEWLLRKFQFAYRLPILSLLAGLLLVVFLVGVALYKTPLNRFLHERGEERLPLPLRDLYERAGRLPPPGSGVCQCKILSIEGNILSAEDLRDGSTTLTIILPLDDKHATTSSLKAGDIVLIAGQEDDGIIRAFGLRKMGGAGFRIK